MADEEYVPNWPDGEKWLAGRDAAARPILKFEIGLPSDWLAALRIGAYFRVTGLQFNDQGVMVELAEVEAPSD